MGRETSSGHVIAGRYELGAIIGRGGHGLVWKAVDRQTGREVAVKMLTDVAAKDPGQVERLRREQLALVKLAGTSAVELLDLCQTSSGKLCLVMELLDGIDLEAHLEALEQRGARIAVASLLSVLAPVVDTLERAHAEGIIHRDLKPANVFLLAEKAGGGVRVLDFGLARLRSALPLTAAGTIVGSPSYIAPEAWKGRSEALDQRVDIYSFGVLTFRALSGSFPFPGTTLQQKFVAATTAERPKLTPLRPDLPPAIDAWVAQVLAIDPDHRFQNLRGAWNGLLDALGDPALATSLVTAEDLRAAAGEAAPLAAAPTPPPPPVRARAPEPAPPPPPPPPPAPPVRSGDSDSIEIPLSGALPALKAAFMRAATVVARATEAVLDRRRTPFEPAPEPVAPPRQAEPAASPAPPASVRISPVIAVGKSTSAREGKSMVREWLAGTDLDVRARAEREPSDVMAWLSGEKTSATREQTLPLAVPAPTSEPTTTREHTLPLGEPAPLAPPSPQGDVRASEPVPKAEARPKKRQPAARPSGARPAKKKAAKKKTTTPAKKKTTPRKSVKKARPK